MAASGNRKAILAALIANSGIAVAKFLGFLVTQSSAMLAEAVHSVADMSNQGLLLLGGRQSRREPTATHPFGYGRERYFWSFVVAVVLFSVGSAFAVYKGIEKVRHPHEIRSVGLALAILGTGIVLEAWSFRIAIVAASPERRGLSWRKFILQTRNPELPVILLEDAGALFGLIIAAASVGLSAATDQPRWDGVGTILIGLLLGVIAAVLAREMKSLLIGESADDGDRKAILAAIGETPGVSSVVHLRTQHLGPDEILVGARVAFDPGLDVAAVAAVVDEVEERVRAVVPAAHPIYVEPANPA
ncbi:MAG: cation diffusion facilitator family transporter [Acidimicrobiales bacterium]|jgi:cation diffusion facilitator family transporter|nr:cation diffusion facilitator family transporter [Acidimicrobiales bacterium]|tara:strand:- start:232 stop:1140 length:909 start_codon:yes stop_codon:yes gene_type:complete